MFKKKTGTLVISEPDPSYKVLLLFFFDPGTQFPRKEKITLCNTKKYKNQAGMNLTPPPPSTT